MKQQLINFYSLLVEYIKLLDINMQASKKGDMN